MISGKEGKGGQIMNAFGGKHYPTIILIGPDKKILEKSIESNQPNKLETILQRHIGATEIIKNMTVHASSQMVEFKGKINNTLRISVTKSGFYTLSVYSLAGKEMLKLSDNKFYNPGIHTIDYATSVNDGMYILHTKSNGYMNNGKILF